MRGQPPSAAAAPLLRRTGRRAFPTPRGATEGCPPDTVCGGRPRDPRGDGKRDRVVREIVQVSTRTRGTGSPTGSRRSGTVGRNRVYMVYMPFPPMADR